MTKDLIKALFLILFFRSSPDMYSQTETIFFSVTGDTVCYSGIFGQSIDSTHTSYTTYIVSRDKNNHAGIRHFFELVCSGPTNTCIETLYSDTIKKYHLELDGRSTSPWTNKDFSISVKPANTHTVELSTFGPKYIFQTTVSINIHCKGQQLYSNTFDIMFKGEAPEDFPERDIVRISAWQKKNRKNYFVDLSIKEHQTFKKPTDREESNFKNYRFIL